jgi:hypothetical protein
MHRSEVKTSNGWWIGPYGIMYVLQKKSCNARELIELSIDTECEFLLEFWLLLRSWHFQQSQLRHCTIGCNHLWLTFPDSSSLFAWAIWLWKCNCDSTMDPQDLSPPTTNSDVLVMTCFATYTSLLLPVSWFLSIIPNVCILQSNTMLHQICLLKGGQEEQLRRMCLIVKQSWNLEGGIWI